MATLGRDRVSDSLRYIWKSSTLTRTEKVMLWLGWTRRSIKRELNCAWCGEAFTWEGDTAGDPPRFCGNTHKLRAKKARDIRANGAQPKKKKPAPAPVAPVPKKPAHVVPAKVRAENCNCMNHMGGPKQKYETQGAAVTQIMRRHIEYGAHRIYRCPSADFWHVTSRA